MEILVTGATGHVGLPLVERLLNAGHSVRTLARGESPALDQLLQLGVTHYSVDICDPNALIQPFSGVEMVFHLAARISYQERDWEKVRIVNVEGVRNVIRACKETDVRRLVHFSSIEAFSDNPRDGVIDETRALVDDDYFLSYPRSKAMGQRLVRQAIQDGLDAIIIHPCGVVGPYDYTVRAGNKVLLKLARQELPVIISGGFNWVDVRDVVDVAFNAALKAPTGASYLAAGHWLSVRDVATDIAVLTGTPAPRWEIPLGLVQPVAPLVSPTGWVNHRRLPSRLCTPWQTTGISATLGPRASSAINHGPSRKLSMTLTVGLLIKGNWQNRANLPINNANERGDRGHGPITSRIKN